MNQNNSQFLGLRELVKIAKHFRHFGYIGGDGRNASRDEEIRKRTVSDTKLRELTEQFDQFRQDADERERNLNAMMTDLQTENSTLVKKVTNAEARGAQDREVAEKRLGEMDSLRKKMKNSAASTTVEITTLQKQNRHLVSKREADKARISELDDTVANGELSLGTAQNKMLTQSENHLREVNKI